MTKNLLNVKLALLPMIKILKLNVKNVHRIIDQTQKLKNVFFVILMVSVIHAMNLHALIVKKELDQNKGYVSLVEKLYLIVTSALQVTHVNSVMKMWHLCNLVSVLNASMGGQLSQEILLNIVNVKIMLMQLMETNANLVLILYLIVTFVIKLKSQQMNFISKQVLMLNYLLGLENIQFADKDLVV